MRQRLSPIIRWLGPKNLQYTIPMVSSIVVQCKVFTERVERFDQFRCTNSLEQNVGYCCHESAYVRARSRDSKYVWDAFQMPARKRLIFLPDRNTGNEIPKQSLNPTLKTLSYWHCSELLGHLPETAKEMKGSQKTGASSYDLGWVKIIATLKMKINR